MFFHCINCNKNWTYPVKKCIFCGHDTEEIFSTKYRVIGYTRVYIPSKGNTEVPYYDYLLEDDRGNKRIWKSYDHFEERDMIEIEAEKPLSQVSGDLCGHSHH